MTRPPLNSYCANGTNGHVRDTGWRSSSSGSGAGLGGDGGGNALAVPGGNSLPPSSDPFWAPVVPETETVAALPIQQQPNYNHNSNNNNSINTFSAHGHRQRGFVGSSGGRGRGRNRSRTGTVIDRPALRGQEYRRERGNNNRRGRLGSSLSSLSSLSSGSRVSESDVLAEQGQPSADGSLSRGRVRRSFLGIPWLPGGGGGGEEGRRRAANEDQREEQARRGRGWSASPTDSCNTLWVRGVGEPSDAKNTVESKTASLVVRGDGVGGGGLRKKEIVHVRAWSGSKDADLLSGRLLNDGAHRRRSFDVGGRGRLHVQIAGSTELGKGLGGHTAYRIQVCGGEGIYLFMVYVYKDANIYLRNKMFRGRYLLYGFFRRGR